MKLSLGFMASKALLSAVELGVFSLLAQGPADRPTLTAKLGLHPRGARDFLDTLVALDMLDRQDGIYRNTPETDLYLDRTKPSYVGGLVEMANARLYGFWGSLSEALRTGELQNEAKHGEDMFGALYADPDRLRGFLEAMSGLSAGSARGIAAKFDWSTRKTFVDVGTAQGVVPAALAQAHPHLRGIGFDLPQVKPVFQAFVARQGLADRVTFQAGNFFTDPLPRADVIIMGHILHDWDLDQKRMLLRKAHEALPPGGALIIFDAMIDDDRRENVASLLISLNMLIETKGGFDYTGADCRQWLREAGFARSHVEPLAGLDCMAVAIK